MIVERAVCDLEAPTPETPGQEGGGPGDTLAVVCCHRYALGTVLPFSHNAPLTDRCDLADVLALGQRGFVSNIAENGCRRSTRTPELVVALPPWRR
jgi:hypothetical protein